MKELDHYEVAVHRLFDSEDGQTVISKYMEEYYTTPIDPFKLDVGVLSYNEGRRSVIRDFISIVDDVNKIRG